MIQFHLSCSRPNGCPLSPTPLCCTRGRCSRSSSCASTSSCQLPTCCAGPSEKSLVLSYRLHLDLSYFNINLNVDALSLPPGGDEHAWHVTPTIAAAGCMT